MKHQILAHISNELLKNGFIFLCLMLAACGGGGSSGGSSSSSSSSSTSSGSAGTPPVLHIAAASVAEGSGGTVDLLFEVTLSHTISEDVTVDYTSTGLSATAGEDYTEINGALTITSGAASTSIAVAVNGDSCYESDETFSITLSNVSSNATLGTASTTGTITNDDQKPELTLADASAPEGDSGSSNMAFTVSLSRASCFISSGDFTSNVVTANDSDFVVATNSFSIPAGDTQATLNVEISGDTFYETDETLTVNLENVSSHINVIDGEAFGTIRTDDLPPLVITPVEITEGNTGTRILAFPVELAGITNEISFDWQTSDLTATVADNDYVETSGTLTIPAGITSTTIQVEVVGDTQPESNEEFRLTLSNLVGDAVLNPGFDAANGTIEDDDTPVVLNPEISAPPAYGSEGDDISVTTEMQFLIVLNTPVTSNITLNYSTSDLSAVAGVDYNAASGTVTILAGQTNATVSVDVRGDIEIEGHEYFTLNLGLVTQNVAALITPVVTGVILDDDIVGPPFLSAQPVAISEGDSGSRDMTVYVTLTSAATDVVSVDYATRDVTALAGSDYLVTDGSLTFDVGETVKTFTVTINGDTVIEADEIFEIALSNMTGNAILFGNAAETSIQTDDPFAMVYIDDVALFEGDSGVTDMVFTVSIDAVAGDPVTMDYISADAVSGNSASEGEDYTAVNGSISIPAGETVATVTVQINGDLQNEFDETFTVTLSNISQNAEFADDAGEGRIVNDDDTPGWGTPLALDQNAQDNILPQIAMNAIGEATVVSAPRFLISPFESVRYAPGTGWGTVETPPETSVTGTVRTNRDLFIDGNGLTTLGWIFGVAQVAQHTVTSGWGSEYEFDPVSNRDQEFIQLAGNEAGSVIAVWKLNTLGSSSIDHLMFSVYDPALDQWSDDDFIAFEGSFINLPDIAMNADGVAIAVWQESSIRASRYDPVTATWSTPEIITNELFPGFNDLGYSPQVAIDNNGNAIAVWDTGSSIGTSVRGSVWASRYDAATATWAEAIQIELGVLDATHAQVKMDAAGNAFVVWLQDNTDVDPWNDSFEIRARRYNAATDFWEPEAVVQNSDTRISQFGFDIQIPLDIPALAVDPAGNAMLVWSENINGEFIIRASRYDSSAAVPAWGPPEQISGDVYPFAIFPDIAIDAAGNAIVVWQMGDSEFFTNTDISEVWWNRYTAP